MDRDVPACIEHTVLGPETTPADVGTVLDAAVEYGMRACIPPCYLESAVTYAPDVTLSTVVGFPHGQHATNTKVEEAVDACEQGADELDVVANLGLLRGDADDRYRQQLAAVVTAVPVPVKVIVETPLLRDEAEKRRAAELATEAGADFLKTATGFAGGGATVADVQLLSEYLPVKASGGIGSWAEAEAMFEAGAERIGASSGVDIVEGWRRAHREADSG